MPGIAGRRARVLVSGAPLDFTDEPCSTADDRIYQIDDTALRFWDREPKVRMLA